MLGSKEKLWLLPPQDSGLPAVPHLFKIGRPNTGENWAEKVAYEIANALELPCANYNLARRGEINGVISERFIPAGANFAFGNLILSQMIPQYDSTLRFKQDKYQLRRMLRVLQARGIGRYRGRGASLPMATRALLPMPPRTDQVSSAECDCCP